LKILFLTDNFYPEANAPANRTHEHCREWVKLGAEVTVVTCVPNFPKGVVFEGYKNKLYQKEMIDGIKVVRVWSYITANEGTIKRIVDYISYAVVAFFAALFHRTDIIIATSPQFFTAISGAILSFFKRKPWIMEVRDIWPESIVAVTAMTNKSVISFLENIEKQLYRSASSIIAVTDSFKINLISKGVNSDKIFIVKNGVSLDNFFPREKDTFLIERLKLENKTIVGYFGTHGMAHKLDFILECAKEIDDDSIHFLFIGDGAERERLLKLKDQMNLNNVTMLSSVAKNEIPGYISIIDIALVNLKKSDTFLSVIPSKIFENAAMEKPILLGVSGETKGIIEYYKAGLCFEPENKVDFIDKLNRIRKNTNLYVTGCKKLAFDYNRRSLARIYFSILHDVYKLH
jgi:glycosyltransferase involved in cell wall biosynthesis